MVSGAGKIPQLVQSHTFRQPIGTVFPIVLSHIGVHGFRVRLTCDGADSVIIPATVPVEEAGA